MTVNWLSLEDTFEDLFGPLNQAEVVELKEYTIENEILGQTCSIEVDETMAKDEVDSFTDFVPVRTEMTLTNIESHHGSVKFHLELEYPHDADPEEYEL